MSQTKSLLHWNQQFDIATGVYDKIQMFRLADVIKSVRSSHSEERGAADQATPTTTSIVQKCWPVKVSRQQTRMLNKTRNKLITRKNATTQNVEEDQDLKVGDEIIKVRKSGGTNSAAFSTITGFFSTD